MKYAVIAKLFPDGRITHRFDYESGFQENTEYDTGHYYCIVDVFDSYGEAREFDHGYRRA